MAGGEKAVTKNWRENEVSQSQQSTPTIWISRRFRPSVDLRGADRTVGWPSHVDFYLLGFGQGGLVD